MRLHTFVAAAVTLSASLIAHADSLSLASFATGGSASGAANTSVTYGASGTTYAVSTNGVWAGPLGSSSWVSFNPGTYPTSGNQGNPPYVAPNGIYTYQTTFSASNAVSGSISVLADDTATVYLNGNLVGTAGSGQAAHCTTTAPSCLVPATFNIASSDFVDGLNTLTFDVSQLYDNGTGLDFAGSVQTGTGVTPEPSSFLLLGTGLLGAAGVLRKRMTA